MLVASEKLTEEEHWSEFGQDELLVCDPGDTDHPRIQRLLGPRADSVEFEPLDAGELSGAARGEWAAQRAATGFDGLGGTAARPAPAGPASCASSLPHRDRAPWSWRLLRRPVTRFFDSVAGGWDQRYASDPERLEPLTAALDLLPGPAARVLDVGTGTGAGAMLVVPAGGPMRR